MNSTTAYWIVVTTSLLSFFSPGLYGMLGGAGFYVAQIAQEPQLFRIPNILVYAFLGFIAGLIVHDFSMTTLGASYPGLLIAAGFSSRKLADIADAYLGLTILKK